MLSKPPRDPAAAVEAALRAAARPEIRASFTQLTSGRASMEAQASWTRHRTDTALGPLDGSLVAWKDVFDLAGSRTTGGSLSRSRTRIAGVDAPVVRNLRLAGAVCLGKTNLSELAFSGLGLNPHFGDPVNPRAADRIPGGSSSGSAVAVAAGIADIGIGTDTSGSTRVPAAFCGIIGFKASPRRYNHTGMLPLAAGLDSIGVFARGMDAVVAADAALRAGREVASRGTAERVRIVVPEGEWLADCDPDVRDAFLAAMSTLETSGIRVERLPVSALDRAQRLMDRHGTLVVAEAYRHYGHVLELDDGVVDPLVVRRLLHGRDRDSAGEQVLWRAMATLRKRVADELAGAILAYPTVRDPAPPVAAVQADPAFADEINRRVLRSTMVTSYLGMPGVALPYGELAGGLVGSVLLSAACGADDTVLTVARLVEQLLARDPSMEETTQWEVSAGEISKARRTPVVLE